MIRQESWIWSPTVSETVYTWKILKLFWNWQKRRRFWQNGIVYWTTMLYFTSGALYWKKQLLILKTNFCRDVMSSFKWAFSHCIRDWNCHLNTIVLAKTFFWEEIFVANLDFHYMRRTTNLYLVEPLVVGTRLWKLISSFQSI